MISLPLVGLLCSIVLSIYLFVIPLILYSDSAYFVRQVCDAFEM